MGFKSQINIEDEGIKLSILRRLSDITLSIEIGINDLGPILECVIHILNECNTLINIPQNATTSLYEILNSAVLCLSNLKCYSSALFFVQGNSCNLFDNVNYSFATI